MDRITLFDENRVLLLSPRWAELGPTLQTVVVLLVCCIPLGLVFWLYRYEMKLVKTGTARTLLCLRVLALVLLLGLVCLQPIYAHETQEELPGRVIVAIDVSESMNVPDPQREPADKLKLARALKLVGDLCSGEQLNEWISQYEAKKTVEFIGPEEFKNDLARRRSEEASRRKGHDAVIERIDKLTRAQTVKQILSPDGLRFLSRLQTKHKDGIEVIGFAGDAIDLKTDAVEEMFGAKDATPKTAPKKEAKDDKGEIEKEPSLATLRLNSTDLELPLVRALERSGAKRGNILGVVLMTDGQHRGAGSPVKRALEMKDQKIPLYPIAFGADKPPPDVAVVAVTAPNSVFKEVEAPLKVRLRATGLKAQDLKVLIHRPGEEDKPLDQRVLKHDGTDQEYVEHFQVRLDKVGREQVQVTVKPQGEDVKEINPNNNRQAVLINVADDTSKVLLVDGEGRWEFHYIWQALLRDRSMKVKSVLFQQPRLGKIPPTELQKLNFPMSSLPPAPKPDEDPLFDYDCIILGDVTPEMLPLPERVRLERYVADRGGTLVVLAGKRAMPQAFVRDAGDVPGGPPLPGDARGESKDPIIRMLPIEEPRVAGPEEGFPVTLTEEGKQTDFMKLESEGSLEDQLNRWAEMPRHHWGVIGKAKPGATTLAYLAGDEQDLKPEEKRKKENDAALFVRHNYGFGRVFFIGLDSTWRYRFRVGDAYHHRFWSQTIRWAASDKPLVTGNKFIRFGTAQALFRDDEAVPLKVRLLDEIDKLPEKLQARARIIRKDGDKETEIALVELKSKQFQQRVLEGQLSNLPPGKYEIQLLMPELEEKMPELKGKLLHGEPGTDGKTELRAAFQVSPGENGEMIKLGTDMTLLKELADKNGTGKVYTPETASELIEQLTAKGMTKKQSEDTRIYSWWLTLVIILTLLTIEWVLRKWAGLP